MLTELVIAMAIGLLLIAGLLVVMTHWIGADGRLLARSKLTQELGNVLVQMRREIERSGYWGRAGDVPDAVNGFQGIIVPKSDCLLYRYDHRGDDPDGIPSRDDMSGFRLKKGVLQYRSRSRSCVRADCDRCDRGSWWALTDPEFLRINALEFKLLETSQDGLATISAVHIDISGELVRSDTATVEMNAAVLVGGE